MMPKYLLLSCQWSHHLNDREDASMMPKYLLQNLALDPKPSSLRCLASSHTRSPTAKGTYVPPAPVDVLHLSLLGISDSFLGVSQRRLQIGDEDVSFGALHLVYAGAMCTN
jgi:hypothetical protein